jgi:hypothetical protein
MTDRDDDKPTTLWTYDFDRIDEVERDRCRRMLDVSALAVFDALKAHLADVSTAYDIMRALGRDCALSEEEVEAHFMMEIDCEAWLRDGERKKVPP